MGRRPIWVVGGYRSSGITINGVKKTVRDDASKLLSDERSEEFSEKSGNEKVFNRFLYAGRFSLLRWLRQFEEEISIEIASLTMS